MTEELTVPGRIEKGKLSLNRERFARLVKEIKDGEVTITVRRQRARRSAAQNAYWWGVCVALVAEHTGYTPEEVHELAKAMFLSKKQAAVGTNGRLLGEYVIGGSTMKLNKLEFGEFVERFRQWAATTLNVTIPDPKAYGI